MTSAVISKAQAGKLEDFLKHTIKWPRYFCISKSRVMFTNNVSVVMMVIVPVLTVMQLAWCQRVNRYLNYYIVVLWSTGKPYFYQNTAVLVKACTCKQVLTVIRLSWWRWVSRWWWWVQRHIVVLMRMWRHTASRQVRCVGRWTVARCAVRRWTHSSRHFWRLHWQSENGIICV